MAFDLCIHLVFCNIDLNQRHRFEFRRENRGGVEIQRVGAHPIDLRPDGITAEPQEENPPQKSLGRSSLGARKREKAGIGSIFEQVCRLS